MKRLGILVLFLILALAMTACGEQAAPAAQGYQDGADGQVTDGLSGGSAPDQQSPEADLPEEAIPEESLTGHGGNGAAADPAPADDPQQTPVPADDAPQSPIPVTDSQPSTAPATEFFNDTNGYYSANQVTVNPRHVYWQDGSLYAECFVANGLSTAAYNVEVTNLTFTNGNGTLLASGAFGLLEGAVIPPYSNILWTFIFDPETVSAYGADLSSLTTNASTSYSY